MGKKTPTTRAGRLARLGGLTSRVSTSYLGQRLVGVFQDEDQRARALNRLHLQNAERVVQTMGSLKGAAMKLGQTVSLFADGVDLSPEVADILGRLNDRAEPVPFSAIREQVEAEIERPLEQAFARFDPEPLGTASLAQAHAAWLSDGQAVVVKVLHRGIEKSVDADLAALRSMLVTGRVLRRDRSEVESIFDEIRERLHEELDYYQEAANLEFFHRTLGRRDGIQVPATHPSLCTERVLTMDRISGVPLREFLVSASPSAKRRAGELLCTSFYAMLFELHALHADPHPGNYLFSPDGSLGLVDFGCVKRYDPFFIGNYARIGLAITGGDKPGTMEAARRLGILVGYSPAAEDTLWRFARTMSQPLNVDEFLCGGPDDHVIERLRRLVPALLRQPDIRSPKDLVFLHRTLGGIYALLRKLEHRYGYRELFRGFAQHAVDVADGVGA